jgi:hypothetical protein
MSLWDSVRKWCRDVKEYITQDEPTPHVQEIPQFRIDTAKDQDYVHTLRAYLEEYIRLFQTLSELNPETPELRDRLQDIIMRHDLLDKTLTSKIEVHSPVPLDLIPVPRLDLLSVQEIQAEFDKVGRKYHEILALLDNPEDQEEPDAPTQYTFTEGVPVSVSVAPTPIATPSPPQVKQQAKPHQARPIAKQALAS